MEKINIEQVKDFIKDNGHIYATEIQRELDKQPRVEKEVIEKCITQNREVFRKLSRL